MESVISFYGPINMETIRDYMDILKALEGKIVDATSIPEELLREPRLDCTITAKAQSAIAMVEGFDPTI